MLFPFWKMNFARSVYSWTGAAENLEKKYGLPKLLRILEKQSGEIETFDT